MQGNKFKKERLDAIRQIERHHFWFYGRRQLVRFALHSHLRGRVRTIADMGCGTGFNLAAWRQFGDRVLGLDKFAAGNNAAGCAQTWFVGGDVSALPLADESADVVIALDVLEHVPETAALAECRRVLGSGGKMFLTVPAFPWLWSFRDDDAGHLRRYTRHSLTQCVLRAGFSVEYLRFYQFFLFPLVAVSRVLGRKRKLTRDMEEFPHPALNSVLRQINGMEVTLIKLGVSFPFGSSLLLVAKKN